MLGASLFALAATDAHTAVHVSYTVLQANCLNGADGGTVAKAHTTVFAVVRASVKHRRRAAALHSVIIRLFARRRAVSVAMHVGNHLFGRFYLNTEQFSERVGGILSAGHAKICRGTARESNGVVVTALVSARAAVCAGQAGADFFHLLVLGNGKKL